MNFSTVVANTMASCRGDPDLIRKELDEAMSLTNMCHPIPSTPGSERLAATVRKHASPKHYALIDKVFGSAPDSS